MTNKFENVKAGDVKLNKDGNLELDESLQAQLGEIAGGVSPEESEDEGITINFGCGKNKLN